MKNKNRKTWIIATILLAFAIIFLINYYQTKISRDYVKKTTNQYYIDNCKCVEYNGTRTCNQGYELKDRFCIKGDSFTNPKIACSQYKCPEYYVNVTI